MTSSVLLLTTIAVTRSDREAVLKVLIVAVGFALPLLALLAAKRHFRRQTDAGTRFFESSFAAFASHQGFTHTPGTLTARRAAGDLEFALTAHAAWIHRGEPPAHAYVPAGMSRTLSQLSAGDGSVPRAYAVHRLEVRVVSARQPWRWPVGAMVSFVPSRTTHQASDFVPTPIHPANARHDQLREAYACFPVTKTGVAGPVYSNSGYASLIRTFGLSRASDYARLPWIAAEAEFAEALVRTGVTVEVNPNGVFVSRGVEGLDSAACRDLLEVARLASTHVPHWAEALAAAQRGAWRDG